MSVTLRTFDWNSTALGPIDTWAPTLRVAFNIVLSATQPMAICWGDQSRLIYNAAWSELLGVKDPAAQARPMREVWNSLPEAIQNQLARVRETGQSSCATDQRLVADEAPASERYFDWVFNPLGIEPTAVCGVLVMVIETTARVVEQRRASLLNALHERSRQEDNAKRDKFLAKLAHELRNPLAAVAAAAQLLAKATDKPSIAAIAREALTRQVDSMARLLDDLLEVSRLANGSLTLQREQLMIADVLSTAIEATRPLLELKRHRLIVNMPHATFYLPGDRIRLKQVFVHLLTNAMKYTDPDGTIEVRAEWHDPFIAVTVKDNGRGLAPGQSDVIFDAFLASPVASPSVQLDSGLGVGLYLVRSLIQLHGGEVVAHSAGVGQGTEFVVRLPAAASNDQASSVADDKSERPIDKLRILVADDNLDSANSCALSLTLSGHETRTAYNGRDALLMAETFRPDVALLDIGMPEMTGYELATQIRGSAWGRHIRLIAVTGWGQEHDKRRATQAGFHEHLTKPVATDTLERLLKNIQAQSRS